MKKLLLAFIAISMLFASVSAWSASTKQEIQALSAQVEEMQKDLAEIKKLLKDGARAPAGTRSRTYLLVSDAGRSGAHVISHSRHGWTSSRRIAARVERDGLGSRFLRRDSQQQPELRVHGTWTWKTL